MPNSLLLHGTAAASVYASYRDQRGLVKMRSKEREKYPHGPVYPFYRRAASTTLTCLTDNIIDATNFAIGWQAKNIDDTAIGYESRNRSRHFFLSFDALGIEPEEFKAGAKLGAMILCEEADILKSELRQPKLGEEALRIQYIPWGLIKGVLFLKGEELAAVYYKAFFPAVNAAWFNDNFINGCYQKIIPGIRNSWFNRNSFQYLSNIEEIKDQV